MVYIIVALVAAVLVQEWQKHKLVERLLLQANIPNISKPVEVKPPNVLASIEKIEGRKKLFSVAVPR